MKQPPSQQPSEADDRNLVVVDENFAEATFEDKVILLLQQNRAKIIVGLIAGCLLIVFSQVIKVWTEHKEVEIQEAYRQAASSDSSADLVAFAQSNSGHKLAGFAYLKVANEEYADQRYSQAAEHYLEASRILSETELRQRALLGHAMASFHIDRNGQGIQTLEALASNPSMLDVTRAEVYYNLAVIYWENTNYEAVKRQIESISALENAGFWEQRAQGLRNNIPELKTVAAP